jgi:hypothetical protein
VRIGVTGHMNLDEKTTQLVSTAIGEHLASLDEPGLVGVSCIARGADSIFAQAVLDQDGTLEVVLPSADYRQAKVKPDHAPLFDKLLAKASTVRTMPFDTANRDAYTAANEAMLSSIDQLVAVWDGMPAPDRGGTAGAVDDARTRGLEVVVIWPEGSRRV